MLEGIHKSSKSIHRFKVRVIRPTWPCSIHSYISSGIGQEFPSMFKIFQNDESVIFQEWADIWGSFWRMSRYPEKQAVNSDVDLLWWKTFQSLVVLYISRVSCGIFIRLCFCILNFLRNLLESNWLLKAFLFTVFQSKASYWRYFLVS